MLKIVGSKEPVEMYTEFGEYMPFLLEFPSEKTSVPIYWRTGDFDKKLLEVGLNKESAAIASIALVLPGEINNPTFWPDNLSAKQIVGVPKIEINEWPESRYKDEEGFLSIESDNDMVLIRFCSEPSTETVYLAGNVKFGVNSSSDLIWISITGLDCQQVANLRECDKV